MPREQGGNDAEDKQVVGLARAPLVDDELLGGVEQHDQDCGARRSVGPWSYPPVQGRHDGEDEQEGYVGRAPLADAGLLGV